MLKVLAAGPAQNSAASKQNYIAQPPSSARAGCKARAVW